MIDYAAEGDQEGDHEDQTVITKLFAIKSATDTRQLK